jgi:hypothetical protein
MNSAAEAISAPSETHIAAPPQARVIGIRFEGPKLICLLAGGRQFALSRLTGSHVRVGDDLIAPECASDDSVVGELYIRKPSLWRADICQVRAGYAALPKPDRRGELVVRVNVADDHIGIGSAHVPCTAIRDYFFSANRGATWQGQLSFYRLLHLPDDVSFKDLRLGYRIRRMELKQQNAARAEHATVERAYNMLADPQIRSVYDFVRKDPTIPVPFPYSGFGTLLVQGERAKDGGSFFANKILAFLPERKHHTISVPLRSLDYFADYAIFRDRKRKLEILIDHQLLSIRWDPGWAQWRDLITANVEISADFVRNGRYRRRGSEWKLVEWETALPSRTELVVPEGIEDAILNARRSHSRFGQYWRHIDHLRAHVQEIPTERNELQRLSWNLGLPGAFDVAQITWRPDYDAWYYEQLSNRARKIYLFRDEYIFDLEHAVAVEVPQAGHATYLFGKPANLGDWVWDYAKTTRQDIRLNRHNIAQMLGFVGRVVHGKNKDEWLNELTARTNATR